MIIRISHKALFWIFYFDILFLLLSKGIARTQSPIRKNYALESPTFVVIAQVNLTEVQWKGLAMAQLPWVIVVYAVPGKYDWDMHFVPLTSMILSKTLRM